MNSRERAVCYCRCSTEEESQKNALEKQVAEAKVSSLENEVRCVGDFKVLTQLLDVEASQLREIAIDIVEKNQVADVAVLINNDGNIVAAANDAVVDYGVKMGDVVSDIGSVLGGRGGGKPNLAQGAKMTELNRIDEAFAVVDSKLGDN